MTPSTGTKREAVPPEEVARRIAEYRRQGFERKTMPHIIYHGAHIACPWAGCTYQIAGIDFQLEHYDTAFHNQALAAWWQGAGLAACLLAHPRGQSERPCPLRSPRPKDGLHPV